MRISDWSSDVCSSDLRETPAAADFNPTQAAPPRAVAEAPAKESLIAADLTIEGKIEGAGHVRIAGKFKGDVNVQGDLTIEKGAKLSGGVKAKKVMVAGELDGNVESRSEEHTSELQSLMRSSYAVFCLKKKKKHTSKTNNDEPTR